MMTSSLKPAVRWLGLAAGAAAAGYGAYAGATWLRYGGAKVRRPCQEADPLLDRFMPVYEVAERHHISIAAPAEITFSAASNMDLLKSRIIRAIFWGREVVLGSKPEDSTLPQSLLTQVKTLGWGVLAEVPGREIVVGAVTQPWEADVVFRALRPDEFIAFGKPGYVKIAWTLCADPIDSGGSVFRTETRALATDAQARAKFRRYWSFVSPGVKLIRWLSLGIVKAEAERSVREAVAELQPVTHV
jgi:hypothetical protein